MGCNARKTNKQTILLRKVWILFFLTYTSRMYEDAWYRECKVCSKMGLFVTDCNTVRLMCCYSSSCTGQCHSWEASQKFLHVLLNLEIHYCVHNSPSTSGSPQWSHSLWRGLREGDHWGDPDVDGRIILRGIFRKWEGIVGTGWSGLRIGTGGGHLWIR
jgi:hypothetical protein